MLFLVAVFTMLNLLFVTKLKVLAPYKIIQTELVIFIGITKIYVPKTSIGNV